nr:protein FAR1-related sequence 5-like [Tanacetum cinerariifolium]
MTTSACYINEADLFVVPVVGEENLFIDAEIEELDDVTMNEDVEVNVILEPDLFVVPVVGEENLFIDAEIEELDDVTMNEDVEVNVILEPGGFEVKKSAQKKTKSGMVKSKKKFVPNFTFHYLVENGELVAMFWADEGAKCNYKELGDIISFYATFRTNKSTLVNFMMCFESAMERQCYRQEVLDFRTFDSAPKLHTKLTIEIHMCKVYTRTISLLVQKEIYEGCWACQIQEFKKEEGCKIVKVRDIKAGAYRTLYTEEGKETVIQEKDKVVDYKVVRNPEDSSVECTCRHFPRYGFPCRHGFCVLKNCNIEFVEKLENIKKEIQVKVPNPPSQKTSDVIEDIYAIKKPKQNLVNNPQKASNKGGRRGEQRKVEEK